MAEERRPPRAQGSPSPPGPREPRRTGSFRAAAATTYLAWAGSSSLGFLNVLIVARSLGATGRGDVALVTAVATLTAVCVSLSVHESHANLAVSRPDSRSSLVANSLVFALVLGAIGAGGIFALSTYFPGVTGEVSRDIFLLALPAIPVVILFNYLSILLRADYHFAVANLALFLVPALTATANGALALTGGLTIRLAVTTWICANGVATALLLGVALRYLTVSRPDGALARESLGFGVRAHGGVVMATGTFRLDQWLVGSLAGSRELGFYSVAVSWAETLFFLPTVVQLVARPDIARGDDARAARRAAAVTRAAVLLSLPLIVVLILGAPLLCAGVFGDDFSASVDDLRILAIGGLGIVVLKILGTALVARDRPLLDTLALSVAFVATIALDLLLIPAHGGAGAALASTAAYLLGGAAAAVVFVRAMGIHAHELVPRRRDLDALVGLGGGRGA